jgi:hypothetical protein
MRNRWLIATVFLLIASAVTQDKPAYRVGTVREVSPVGFEPTDVRPMFCKVRIESHGSELTFITESPQTTTQISCEKEYTKGKEIQFRTVQQDVFVRNPRGKELKGLLEQPGGANTSESRGRHSGFIASGLTLPGQTR